MESRPVMLKAIVQSMSGWPEGWPDRQASQAGSLFKLPCRTCGAKALGQRDQTQASKSCSLI